MENIVEKECCCGRIHSVKTKSIVVSSHAFSQLVKCIIEDNYKKVLILNSIEDLSYVEKLKKEIRGNDIEINVINLPKCNASTYVAEKIEDKLQELVVALGGEELISVAKYYAYMYECDLYIFPVSNFVDFTFSKYSRLFDGVQYNFYQTLEPSRIFVSTIINNYNFLHTYYISSKYIAIFDNVLALNVYQSEMCERAKNYLKDTLKDYSVDIKSRQLLNERNIWTLVRIGQAMSFYSETKPFFGGDKAIVDLLGAQVHSADYLKLETIALKLIINLYSCFFKSYPTKANVNLNKHIMAISDLLKISSTEIIKRISNSELLTGSDIIFKRFNNFYPYLKGVLSKCLTRIFSIHSRIDSFKNIIKIYNLSQKRIEKTFALSSCFFNKPCALHLFSAFGYLDKLL